MSRCFPFPPPGYVRNPVAVAEAETTAKLQKEKDRAEKKQKRSERKALKQAESSKHSKHGHKKRKHEDVGTAGQELKTVSKESVEQLEKSGLSEEHGAPCFTQTVLPSPESSQDSSKRRKVVLSSPSQSNSGSKLRLKVKMDQDSARPMVIENLSVKQPGLGSSQLSKPNSIQQHSKVTAKSGATVAPQRINVEPRAIQKQVTSQLPAKFVRRDDPQLSNVVQQIHSKAPVKPPVERVGLPPARSDPISAAAQQRINVQPQIQKQASSQLPAKFVKRDGPQLSNVVQQIDSKAPVNPPVGRVGLLPARSGPPSAAEQQRSNVQPQAIQKQASSQLPSKFVRRDDPQMPNVVQQIHSKAPVKPPVGRVGFQPARIDPPSAKVVQRDLPGKAAPAKVRVNPQVPSAEIPKKCPPQPKVLQEFVTPAGQPEKLHYPLVQNLKLEAPGDQMQRPIVSVPKEQPSTSGRKTEAVQRPEVKQSKSDLHKSRKAEKKAEKKEKKIRDLFVSWNPPSFEMEGSDVSEQDWLFGSTRNSDASMTKCRASDGSVPSQSMEHQPSFPSLEPQPLQPRATFLPDFQMFQLPYVVPF